MPQPTPLPKLEDWTPPWGEDPDDINPDELKKYLHGLLSDKEKGKKTLAAANAKVTEAEKARDALQEQLDQGNSPDVKDLQSKLTKAEDEAKKAKATSLRLEVAIDKGLSPVQAKRLIGETLEELETDADDLLESFGGQGKAPDDEENEEDEGKVPTRTPNKLNTPLGRTDDGAVELSDEAIALAVQNIPRNQF